MELYVADPCAADNGYEQTLMGLPFHISSMSSTHPANDSACPVAHSSNMKQHYASVSATFDPSMINGGEGTVPTESCTSQSVAIELDLPPGHPPIPRSQSSFREDTKQEDSRLSNVAISSNVPRGGVEGDEFWQYPSPQRFYNAMKRKGYEPNPEDMQMVVSIHNTVNEKAWKEVMEYERYHFDECPDPKLLRFRGRPTDLSIKARILKFLGYTAPFDRHDWIVDRCGFEQRYILDFYSGKEVPNYPVSIFLDVRPDLATMSGIKDRLRKTYDDFIWKSLGQEWMSTPPLPHGPYRRSSGREHVSPTKPPQPPINVPGVTQPVASSSSSPSL